MKRSGPPKRKTPLKTKKGLQSGSGLKSGGELKRTELKKRSEKRQRVMQDDRIPLIKQLVEAGFGCEIGPVLEHYGEADARHCRGRIEGIHELRKRSDGGSLVNRDNLVPACNFCNGWVEDHPAKAREIGLVIRAGDPDYERLGARHDRDGDDLQGTDAG